VCVYVCECRVGQGIGRGVCRCVCEVVAVVSLLFVVPLHNDDDLGCVRDFASTV
jgi:hypothetical protein